MSDRPLLLLDVDGVISLFGFDPDARPPGRFALVEGIAHWLSEGTGALIARLQTAFDVVWCTGWEERANEHLVALLALGRPLPTVALGPPRIGERHWKLAGIEAHVDPRRPLAWVDDAHDESCGEWARRRAAPTLLLRTDPAVGLTAEHVGALLAWARALAAPGPGRGS